MMTGKNEFWDFTINDNLAIMREAMNIRIHAEDFVKAGMFETVQQAYQYAYALLDKVIADTSKSDA